MGSGTVNVSSVQASIWQKVPTEMPPPKAESSIFAIYSLKCNDLCYLSQLTTWAKQSMTFFPSRKIKDWASRVLWGGWLLLCFVRGFVCLLDLILISAEWKFRSPPWVTQEPPGSFGYNTWVTPGCIFKLFHPSQMYSLDFPRSKKGVKEDECTPRNNQIPKPCVGIHLWEIRLFLLRRKIKKKRSRNEDGAQHNLNLYP